jgi:hypothetical protein
LTWDDFPGVPFSSKVLKKLTLDLVVTSSSEDELATVYTNGFCLETFSRTDLDTWFIVNIFSKSCDMSSGVVVTELSSIVEESWVAKAIPELDEH